jgi:hypothetical protein
MNTKLTPASLALRSFAVCLAICSGVVALFFYFGDASKAKDPVRLGIMLFVLVTVPVGNYFVLRRRHGNAG